MFVAAPPPSVSLYIGDPVVTLIDSFGNELVCALKGSEVSRTVLPSPFETIRSGPAHPCPRPGQTHPARANEGLPTVSRIG
jgi:hypothetical protein